VVFGFFYVVVTHYNFQLSGFNLHIIVFQFCAIGFNNAENLLPFL
jgi:hypothetical protein